MRAGVAGFATGGFNQLPHPANDKHSNTIAQECLVCLFFMPPPCHQLANVDALPLSPQTQWAW
jgi:hypothetical protein